MTPIVMSETEEGRRVVTGNIRSDLASSPFYTLSLVARYLHLIGRSKGEITECLAGVAESMKAPSYIVDTVINSDYDKKPPVDVNSIAVSADELKIISGVGGGMKRKVLFTLLCLAKYHNEYTGNYTNWENRTIEEVSSLANVSLSKERMCYLLYDLKEAGLISFSNRVSSTNIHVDFADESSGGFGTAIFDMRNLGWQYERICGKRFSLCEECGAIFPYNKKYKTCGNCRGGQKFTIASGLVPTRCEVCGKEMFVLAGKPWYGNICENCK